MQNELPAVEVVPVASIKPAPWNPRDVDAEDLEGLKRSIQDDPDFLALRPPLVRRATMEIYAGCQRWLAARELEWENIPAIITDISEEEAKIRAAKDNAHHGQNSREYPLFLQSLATGGLDLSTVGHGISLEAPALDLGTQHTGSSKRVKEITCPHCEHKFHVS